MNQNESKVLQQHLLTSISNTTMAIGRFEGTLDVVTASVRSSTTAKWHIQEAYEIANRLIIALSDLGTQVARTLEEKS